MSQGKKLRYVKQGEVEKYGRVPPKPPAGIAKRSSSTMKLVEPPKPSGANAKVRSIRK
jgi:hypothetical protein